eukprot:Clim_evm12s157 gene=Clim_evmTU12s157
MLSRIIGVRGLQRSATSARRHFHASAAAMVNLHEYQSKDLLHKADVVIQPFAVVGNPSEVKAAIENHPDLKSAAEYVVKAQIRAGGRGKGTFDTGFKGGVHLTTEPTEVEKLAKEMLGNRLKTKQTKPEGVEVTKVMIAKALNIARETYVAVLMDPTAGGPVLLCSPDGGMDIEAVAAATPERIFTSKIDLKTGVTQSQAEDMAAKIGFTAPEQKKQAAHQLQRLYDLFVKLDATQIEINPFGETDDGQVVCFDAKMNFDDNARFRQSEIFESYDPSEDDPREVRATAQNLNYIGMEGNIGCLVNGAGLAMATMDIIKLNGGVPANFLDVGGSVKEDQVKEAFQIISDDPQVKAILVNIFGGIVNCATIANGIVGACKSMDLKIPLIVRLAGTNFKEGQRILDESGLPIITADDLDEAAVKAVQSIQ